MGTMLDVNSIERAETLLIAAGQTHHIAERFLRALDVAKLIFVNAGEAFSKFDAIFDGRLDEKRIRVGRGELEPAIIERSEALDLIERSLVGRIFEKRALHPERRAIAGEQPLFSDRSRVVHELDALGRIALEMKEMLVEEEQLVPLLLHSVERLEELTDLERLHALIEKPLEGGHGVRVGGLGLKDAAIRVDGPLDIADVGLRDVAEAIAKLEDLVGAGGHLDLLFEDIEELGPLLGLIVEPIERLDGLEMARVDPNDRPEPFDGGLCLFEVQFVDLSGAKGEVDEITRRILAKLVELHIVERNNASEAAVDLVREALEVAERTLVERIACNRTTIGLEGRGWSIEVVLVEIGDMMEEIDGRDRILLGAHLNLEDADELRRLAHRAVDRIEHERGGQRLDVLVDHRLERVEGRLMRRIDLENLTGDIDGARGIAEAAMPELGDAVAVSDLL